MPAETTAETVSDARRSAWKLATLVLVALTTLVLLRLTPLRDTLGDASVWHMRLRNIGAWALPAFFFLAAGLVALGAPRLALAMLAGALFGFIGGATVAWFSAALGSYVTFLFARWGARDWVRRRVRLPERARALLLRPDVWAVVLLRQMPIVAVVQNAALGLTDAPHRVFWFGTLLGTLPSTLVAALIGASVARETWRGALGHLAAAMAVLAIVGALADRWRRAKKMSQ